MGCKTAYCLRNSIARNDRIFPLTERAVQKQLAIVCDYLGYECISTHSFRKWYATEIYKDNGFDIALVQRLFSTAAHRSHSAISALSHSALKRRLKDTRSLYKNSGGHSFIHL